MLGKALSFLAVLCSMTQDEERFMEWWRNNRDKEQSWYKQVSFGLPIGLLLATGIILNFAMGWYTRANMVANSQSTLWILLLAVFIIAIFCSVFYKRHRWEMNEQRFLELTAKQKRNKTMAEKQQEAPADGQGGSKNTA